MNPVFVEKAVEMVKGGGVDKIRWMLGYVNLFVLAVMLFALLLDIGVTAYRATRYDKI